MKRILFLHPNFPGQFKEPCLTLANKEKHEIVFVCQTHYGRSIKGVNKLVIKGRGSHDRTIRSSEIELNRSLYRADAYREAFVSLKNHGWNPDVVFSHCGWGCGIYLKDIWPECRFIAYLEWWFNPSSVLQKRLDENKYFQLSEASNAKLTLRNLPACYEMSTADEIMSPTSWQKQQLPKHLKERCLVIPDSIDRTIFFPEPHKQSPTPVLTYGTRGMEPMRGFPEFIKSLERVLLKWPQLSAEIAGTDSVNYGGKTPSEGSWKNWAIAQLQKHNLNDRVYWKGRMPLHAYASWLKGSWCHVYLSEPFVTSWSLIEACHCAIPMVATRSPATDEFSHLNPFLIQVTHTNEDQLVEAISNRIRFSSNFNRNNSGITNADRAEPWNSSNITLYDLIAGAEVG